jgi:transposase
VVLPISIPIVEMTAEVLVGLVRIAGSLSSCCSQLARRLANVPRCLVGMEACSGAHHIGRQLEALGHDVRLIPAQYVKPFLKGHKNDYRDAEAIAEAVQRPTMHFVRIKTPEQMDLLALHKVRSRLVRQRTGTINQIRGFLIERGITVRQRLVPLRKALCVLLAAGSAEVSPRILRLLEDLAADWRRLDERIKAVSAEIEALAEGDESCQRLMTVPGIGPIISSAVVAAIGNGAGFKQGRDFGAWLGLVPRQESTGDRSRCAGRTARCARSAAGRARLPGHRLAAEEHLRDRFQSRRLNEVQGQLVTCGSSPSSLSQDCVCGRTIFVR